MKEPTRSTRSTRLFTALATALAAAFAASAKTFDWPIDSPAAGARQFTAYHGETVRFNLRLSGAMTNLAPVAIYYQTNGMGKAEWFGPVPGTVFHPTNDCGAAAYRFFILCNDPDGKDYTANGSLRLLDSPGFEPSAVQLPVQTLDFSKVAVLNPPWPDHSDLDSATTAATNYTDAATNAALSAAKDYADDAIQAAGSVTPEIVTNIVNGVVPAPDFTTGNAQLVATIAATAPAPDLSTNNAVLVETIEATAPAPGDYAAVSNAAMNALSRAEAEAGVTEWTVHGAYRNGTDILGLSVEWMDGAWTVLHNGDTTEPVLTASGQDATHKVWDVESGDDLPEGWGYVDISRTRLPRMADLDGKASAADVTAAIRDLSLGGIWDEALQVWWTPRMRSGSLTYEATTNVNLNAEN